MFRRIAIIITAVLALSIFAAIIYSATQPKPYRWHPRFSSYGKQPYDTYVFYDQLHSFFPGKKVRKIQDYDFSRYYLDELYDVDSLGDDDEYYYYTDSTAFLTYLDEETPKFNFIGLNKSFYLENLDAKALLLHLYQGNHAIIAGEDISNLMLKMLGIEMSYLLLDSLTESEAQKHYTITYKDNEPVEFKNYETIAKFTNYPDSAIVVASNENKDILGLEVPLGKGSITLFSVPIIFTNYYLLKEDRSLVEAMIKNLPNEETIWAERVEGQRVYSDSPSIMAFIHSEKALSWAFYTLISGVLVYLILQLRRTERAVPVINKPKNISLNFIESVSALFFLHKDNRELVIKKMNYFLDQVRVLYHMDTNDVNDHFINVLAKKSKVKPALLTHIFKLYETYVNKPEVSNEEFLRFNKLMQTFKNRP
ncbi:MAG: hypothetical protein DRI71_02465 [Bacteroidetes bacterium]|nr:MAG: hypothetical protein DRI71_02465 [Bacteroidota bacterium]